MPKRKVELNNQVESLVNKYLEITDDDFNDVVNESLSYYLKKKMTTKEVRETLKNGNSENVKFLDEYLHNNIHNHWEG